MKVEIVENVDNSCSEVWNFEFDVISVFASDFVPVFVPVFISDFCSCSIKMSGLLRISSSMSSVVRSWSKGSISKGVNPSSTSMASSFTSLFSILLSASVFVNSGTLGASVIFKSKKVIDSQLFG